MDQTDHHSIQTVLNSIQLLKTEYEETRKSIDECKRAKIEVQTKVAYLQEEKHQLQECLENLYSAYAQMSSKKDLMDWDLICKRKEIECMSKEYQERSEEVELLKRRYHEQNEHVMKMVDQMASEKRDLLQIKQQVVDTRNRLETDRTEAMNELNTLDQQVEKLKVQWFDLNSSRDNLSSRIVVEEEEYTVDTKNYDQTYLCYSAVRQEYEAVGMKLSETISQTRHKHEKLKLLTSSISSTREKQKENQRDLKQVAQKIQQMRKNMEIMERDIQHAEEDLALEESLNYKETDQKLEPRFETARTMSIKQENVRQAPYRLNGMKSARMSQFRPSHPTPNRKFTPVPVPTRETSLQQQNNSDPEDELLDVDLLSRPARRPVIRFLDKPQAKNPYVGNKREQKPNLSQYMFNNR